MTAGEHEVLRCSFCNKRQNEVRKLIAGPKVFICDECVDVCVDIVADDSRFQEPVGAQAEKTPIAPPRRRQSVESCSLCGRTAAMNVLAVAGRGVLCGDCADAVEDALLRGQPLEG